jgi:hypothetical protein
MNEYNFTVTFSVMVKTDLPMQEAIDEFGSNCDYELPSTDNVKVVSTEWLDTE